MVQMLLLHQCKQLKLSNLDLAASAINSYEFSNTATTGAVVQNSTTLVVGETGQFQNLK